MIELNKKEKALLIAVDIFSQRGLNFKIQEELSELNDLVKTAGLDIIEQFICRCDKPSAAFFIGSGKARELSFIAADTQANAVVFSVDLSPTQSRNLEEKFGCKIIDRTQLILDIFSLHARSLEGRTQVELAQLEYLLPRLSGKGTILSRLGGGIGTRGPGEQKLELDRRHIRRRISSLKIQLEKMRAQSALIRKSRLNEKIPLVSLVGYTNAGKTTLLNALTNETQLTDNSLFTTLDPLSRTLTLRNNQKIILTDTVGFLHNLPHRLIEAFKSTLEDTKQADLLLHVLDISHHSRYDYHKAVVEVLKDLNCLEKPIITVLNKKDKLEDPGWLQRYKSDFPNSIEVSSLKRNNLEELLIKISENIPGLYKKTMLEIPLDKMHLVDLIYRQGNVTKIKYTNTSVIINAELPLVIIAQLSPYRARFQKKKYLKTRAPRGAIIR